MRCRRVLPLRDFPLRRKDGTQRFGHCRSCKAAYQQQWYERNRQRHRAMTAARRAIVRRINKALVETAKSRPCADCGGCFPTFVMDFDHARGKKIGNVAHMKTNATTAALAAEIAKCDVVCANCHRMRTHIRGHYRARPSADRSVLAAATLPPGVEQLRFEWVAGGSNSEPWA